MTLEEIKALVEPLAPWYHRIELAPGYFTPSNMQASFPQWDNVRKARQHIYYGNRIVLDIGTMDGMWAFEAEKLGASHVYACDVWQNEDAKKRFRVALAVLESKVRLAARCDAQCLIEDMMTSFGHCPPFDIVQCLGMLYHVHNPMAVLTEIHRALSPDGVMLLETAVWPHGGDEPIARFNSDLGVYNDPYTYWAPNEACLRGMLKEAGFRMVEETRQLLTDRVNRIAVGCVKI